MKCIESVIDITNRSCVGSKSPMENVLDSMRHLVYMLSHLPDAPIDEGFLWIQKLLD